MVIFNVTEKITFFPVFGNFIKSYFLGSFKLDEYLH